MKLEPLTQNVALYCGELGIRWGINSTAGQIYALLFVVQIPFNPLRACCLFTTCFGVTPLLARQS